MNPENSNQPQRHLDVDRLKPGRWQPRRQFDDDKLHELAQSIDSIGVIEPLIVRLDKRDGLYEIVAGERRWRAAQRVAVYQVPVIVRNDLDDHVAQEIALIENLQREDLNPIEEAAGLYNLIHQLDLTQMEAAVRIGKSRPYITNSLSLLDLPNIVQDLLRARSIEPGHAKLLRTLPQGYQIDLAKMTARLGWSVRQLSRRVKETKAFLVGEDENSSAKKDPNLVLLESTLRETYSMPTSISYDEKNGKGRVVIDFYSIEELQGLLNAWGVSVDK